jgi:hypothetical protein
MPQPIAESFSRSFLEIAKHAVDAADIHPGMLLRNRVCTSPPMFIGDDPRALGWGQCIE